MKTHTKKVVPIAKNWAAQLVAAIGTGVERGRPGAGWVTIQEYADATVLSYAQAARDLRIACTSGKTQRVQRILRGKITNFYKLK